MCLLIITLILGIRNPSFSLCIGVDVCLDDLKCSNGKSSKGLGALYLLICCAMMTIQSLVAAELLSLKNNYNFLERIAVNSHRSLNQGQENSSDIKDAERVLNINATGLLTFSENDQSFEFEKSRVKMKEANEQIDKLIDDIYVTDSAMPVEKWEQTTPDQLITVQDLESTTSKKSRPLSRESTNTIPEDSIYKAEQKGLQNLSDKSKNDIYSMPSPKRREKIEKTRVQPVQTFSESDSKDSDKRYPKAAQKLEKDNTAIKTSYTNYSKKDLTISKSFIRDRLMKRTLRSEANAVSKIKNAIVRKNSFKSLSEMPQVAAPALILDKRPEDVPYELMEIIEDELGGLYLSDNKPNR